MNFLKDIFGELRAEASSLYQTFKCEIIRIIILLIIGLALLRPDDATLALVSYSFGLSFLLIAASHLCRKILFRRQDLAELADAALKEGNIAAALVFLSICISLIALMYFMAAPLLR